MSTSRAAAPLLPPPLAAFVRAVKQRYAPAKVILFGSRARGEERPWSDYDFIVISARFERIHFLDRGPPVRLLFRAPIPIDVICLTPQEFDERRKRLGVVHRAAIEGIEVTA